MITFDFSWTLIASNMLWLYLSLFVFDAFLPCGVEEASMWELSPCDSRVDHNSTGQKSQVLYKATLTTDRDLNTVLENSQHKQLEKTILHMNFFSLCAAYLKKYSR